MRRAAGISAVRVLAWLALFLAASALALPAARAETVLPEGVEEVEFAVSPAPLLVHTREGTRRFAVEVADDPRKRARGLMYRRSMAPDAGMLFCFDRTRPVNMWMKNTVLPLDMIFAREDGTVARVAEDAEPYSEAVVSSGEPVRFVLEINAGQAREQGIAAGDRLSHPSMQACLEKDPARG